MEAKKIKPVLLLSLLLLQAYISAQNTVASDTCNMNGCCCGGNDVTPAGVMISHVHPKNEWMVSYRYMNMNMHDISAGTSSRNETDVLTTYTASPNLMWMNMHMVMAMYGITDRLTAMAMINYNSNYMEMTMPVGKSIHKHGMSSAGIGDTRLYGLYAVSKKPTAQLLISLGVNLPAGSISAKGEAGSMMYPGQRLPYGMQLGSGTYDLLPCISYLHQKRKITYSAQLASMLRTGNNSIGYSPGNELNLNAWAAWQWLSFISSTLRLDANAAGRITGKDPALDFFMEPSANPANYGGKRLFTYVGSCLQPKRGFLRNSRFSVEYGLPVYQDLNGIQMKTSSNLYVAYSITF